jgi:FkbM family methyltransferase
MGVLNYESSKLSGERALLQRIGRIGWTPTVLDVGAHDGGYISEVLEFMPNANIFGFEPHPDSFNRLQKMQNKQCTVVNAAVGEAAGTCTLYDYARAQGSQHASTIAGVINEIHHDNDVNSWTVPRITLDDFVRTHAIPHIHLLKIDTEGAELNVLRGAESILKENKIDVIQLEFNSIHVLSRVFVRDIRDALSNFVPYRLLPDGPVPLESYNPTTEEIFAFQNLLFISKELPLEIRAQLVA